MAISCADLVTVPMVRRGSSGPSFLEPRRRWEAAVVNVVALAGTVVLTVAIVASFSALASPGLPADPNTPTLAFTGLGLADAALGFFIAKAIECNNGREDRLSAQKRAAYAALMSPWLGASVRDDDAETDDPAPGDGAESQSPDFLGVLMFGSDAVVRAYGDFRSAATNPSASPSAITHRSAVRPVR